MKSSKKLRIPFYMRTNRIRHSMLSIKDYIFSYKKNLRSIMPTVAELNSAFGNMYNQTKNSYRRELQRIEGNNRSRNTTPAHIRKSLLIERQQKYQEIFCSPEWSKNYWETLNSTSTNCAYKRNHTIQRRLEQSLNKESPKQLLSNPKNEVVKAKLTSVRCAKFDSLTLKSFLNYRKKHWNTLLN